jgi:hypothetical protein
MPTRKQQYETYKSIIQNVDLIQTKYATIKSNIYLSKLKKLKDDLQNIIPIGNDITIIDFDFFKSIIIVVIQKYNNAKRINKQIINELYKKNIQLEEYNKDPNYKICNEYIRHGELNFHTIECEEKA